MSPIRLFLEQDPPSQAIHSGVVGFIVLIFIVARVLTTRGFAALKPGFNTRAIVTWFACTSLTLMTTYSAMLAYLLYKESMAGVYVGPKAPSNFEPVTPTTFTFPLTVSFNDMSQHPEWDISQVTQSDDQSPYYILSMKPTALYSIGSIHFLFALRLVLKLSQCGLMACLLLLNTYWCHHVEALVDEGNFMSKSEMYTYYVLAGLSLFAPAGAYLGVGFGLNDWKLAWRVSDVCLLIIGVGIIIGYALTCIRLRALERDSRNGNGGDTSTTLQLTYYVYCVYWLIGSMIIIMLLGILYKFTLVNPDLYPVRARAMNDLQGALWSTVIIMVYPAAMFLLYPSVDVLTQPSNDPGSRFQKRVRRDAKRIRDSLYLEGDSLNGVDGGHHSSQHGLTINPGHSNRSSESGQPHTPQPQRFSFSYEPYRRERMGSITAMVNELQLIQEEEGAGTESVELAKIPGSLSDQKEDTPVIHTIRAPSMDGNKTVTEVNPKSDIAEIRKKSGSFTRNRNETKDMEEQSRARATTWSEQTIAQDNHSHDDNKNDFIVVIPATAAAATVSVMSKYDSKGAALSDPDPQKPATLSTTVSSNKSATPIKPTTTPKPPVAPLTGILKTRNSTQGPPDQAGGAILPATPSASTPTIGKRMSSMQGAQHTIGSRKSAEYAPVKRKNSTSSSTSKSPAAVSISAPNTPVDPPLPSPASQQRRSNVTARVDAGALALAAQQQHHLFQQQPHQRAAKSRSSRDGIEVDYFGLRKPSSDGSATTPPPLPYEPQMQVIQSMNISPEMTGFLMADPYPSAGTRYNEGDGDQDMVSDTLSEGGHGDSYKRAGGNVNCSKKYKAPPPPIPIDTANARSTERVVGVSTAPATPTTPTTPLGVRPRRSVDTVVDPQILEMAGKMYEDHVIPEHVMQAMSRTTPSAPSNLPATSPEAPVVHAIKVATPGSPVRVVSESSAPQSPIQPNQQSPPQQYQRVVSPPAKSPYRARESFESRITQGGPSATGSPYIPGQGIATPPSPTSTASPIITSTTTLPRPLTPAWYETKTNSASTNDVLHRYNAVTRGGNYQQQQQQQHQQQPQPQQQQQQQVQPSGNKLLFYDESPIGPLDDAATTPHHQQQQEDERYRESYLPQPRMGSADSFGVVRTRLSSGKDDEQRYQQHQVVQRTPQHQQQIDRHSFMMPSDHLSTHTWTGNLSDVTTHTSGEVSVGAFVDRKHPHQQHHRRKSGDESEAKDRDVRKSQASAYSMGSCFGVGSSAGSRQSAGAYSNYSSNSGFGSGSIFVSGSLSAVGQAGSGSSEALLTVGSGALHKQHSGPLKKRSSDHRGGHGNLNESSGSSTGGSSHGHGHEGGSKETHLSDAPSRMNSVRLSAFGPGEEEEDGIPAGDTNMDMQMSLELERKIQQEWIDRRAAVKKDSKTRLEQLHKQHQEQAEQEQQNQQRLQQRDRQQRYLQFQMDQEHEIQEGADPSSRAESTHMSVNAASPGDSAISTPSTTTAASGTTEPPSPSPNSQFMYSPASRPYESTTLSSYGPRQVGRTQGLESEYVGRAEENDDEGSNALMQSSTSYALHRQSRNKLATPQNALTLQQPLPTANPSLLHYDSVDSIATIRATHRYPSVSPSPSSPSPQRPSSSRSGPSSPSSPSPSPMAQRPLYGQYHQSQQGFYPPQPHYQQPRSQQPPSPGASISQVGPSQYRIVPDNLAQRERVGATGVSDGEDPTNRSMSPIQRTSSRLTNLTSTGSDYQWESAELNQHQWEMLGTSTSRSN